MTQAEFRDGLTLLTAVRFGEACKRMMQQLLKVEPSDDSSYDLLCPSSVDRVEVKFAIVKPKQESCLSEGSVSDWIEEAKRERKFVNFANWRAENFSCSFGQIKKFAFDVLYYGLCFFDCIRVFKIRSGEIDERVHYSDSQYRCGTFHVTPSNLGFHLENHLFASLTYDAMLELTKDRTLAAGLPIRRRSSLGKQSLCNTVPWSSG